jgi:preprotein translocase subunit SecE
MTYSRQHGRFRGSKKQLARIRFTAREKWFAVLLAVLIVIAMMAGAWLGFDYED